MMRSVVLVMCLFLVGCAGISREKRLIMLLEQNQSDIMRVVVEMNDKIDAINSRTVFIEKKLRGPKKSGSFKIGR